MKAILSTRLILIPALRKDAKELVSLLGTTANKLIFFRDTLTLEREREYLEKMKRSESNLLLIIRETKGKIVGTIGLHEIDQTMKTARLGIMIGAPYQNSGFGSEAASTLIDYAFTTLGLEKIYVKFLTTNETSRNFFEKLKFVKEGVLRGEYPLNGQRLDMIRMSILKTDL